MRFCMTRRNISGRRPLRAGLALAAALAALAVTLPVQAQTNYGPGPGGNLVDGAIGGPREFTSDIVLSSTGLTVDQITAVTLTGFTHTWVGDLEISLLKVGTGERVVLTAPPFSKGANLNGTYSFVVNPSLPTLDEALRDQELFDEDNIPQGAYAISSKGDDADPGPRGNFDNLAGVDLDGTWRLTIRDSNFGDTGALGGWTFTAVTSAPSAAVPEPGAAALMGGTGLLVGVGAVVRHRGGSGRRRE